MDEDTKAWQDVSSRQQRHISVQRFFEVSLLLMLATAFLTLSSTGKLDAPSITLFSAALGLKLWTYARGESGYRLQQSVVNRLAAGYLFFFVIDLAFLEKGPDPADRVLHAAIHMILFITVMKIFAARRYRDYAYLAALSFLMMLAAAVLTASSAYLLGLSFYVLFAICMFISFDIKSGMDWASQPARGPYPAVSRNRVALENSLAATALELAIGAMAVAAILFFIIPRRQASFLAGFSMPAENVTGFSDNVSLGDIGRIKRSNFVVMRVRPRGSYQQFEGIYWRGVALGQFSGRGWRQPTAARTRLVATSGNFILPATAREGRRPRRLLRYQVLLSSISTDVLFAAAQPIEVAGRFPAIALDESRSLHRTRKTAGPVEYTVTSNVGLPAREELRRDDRTAPAEIRAAYLSTPPLDPRIAALARRVTESQPDNYDRALAIQNYLRSHFGYTLNPKLIQPSDPVGSFLFVSRKGYCIYFASAMALMLRTLGIPARVVNGFKTGEYNPVAGDFIVRARDAHSWVEAYFTGYGWIPFDPTPAASSKIETTSAIGDYLDAASLFWNEWIINYSSGRQMMLGRRAEQDSHRMRQKASAWCAVWRARSADWLQAAKRSLAVHKLPMLCLILLLAGGYLLAEKLPWFRELRFRVRFRRGKGSAQQAAMIYGQLLIVLRGLEIQRAPSQTPDELARSLSHSRMGSYVGEFTRLYNALRFGNEAIPPGRFLALLRELSTLPNQPNVFQSRSRAKNQP